MQPATDLPSVPKVRTIARNKCKPMGTCITAKRNNKENTKPFHTKLYIYILETPNHSPKENILMMWDISHNMKTVLFRWFVCCSNGNSQREERTTRKIAILIIYYCTLHAVPENNSRRPTVFNFAFGCNSEKLVLISWNQTMQTFRYPFKLCI